LQSTPPPNPPPPPPPPTPFSAVRGRKTQANVPLRTPKKLMLSRLPPTADLTVLPQALKECAVGSMINFHRSRLFFPEISSWDFLSGIQSESTFVFFFFFFFVALKDRLALDFFLPPLITPPVLLSTRTSHRIWSNSSQTPPQLGPLSPSLTWNSSSFWPFRDFLLFAPPQRLSHLDLTGFFFGWAILDRLVGAPFPCLSKLSISGSKKRRPPPPGLLPPSRKRSR